MLLSLHAKHKIVVTFFHDLAIERCRSRLGLQIQLASLVKIAGIGDDLVNETELDLLLLPSRPLLPSV